MKTTLSLLVSAVLVCSSIYTIQPAYAEIPVSKLEGDVPSLAPILEGSMPAVVNIAAKSKSQMQVMEGFPDPFQDPFFNNPMFQQFFGDDSPFGNSPFGNQSFQGRPQPRMQEEEAQAIGSGVIVDAGNGYVITNYHVVNNADEIYVVLQDKSRLPAKVIGSDSETDIAVLKVEGKNLTALPMGDSDKLRVGDYVIAVGSPFGLSHTVTSGIVSALGRSGLGIEGYEDFIQTDASINPGNSGGALMDLRGNLIGINTAIMSRNGGSMGIGFSIPINMVKSVMNQIITKGSVERGQVGIAMQDVTQDLADALGLKDLNAVLITNVVPKSPADKAGLRSSDVITHVDGAVIEDSAHLKNLIGLKNVGDKVKLSILREGKASEVDVEIGKIEKAQALEAKNVDLLEGAQFSAIPTDHPLSGKTSGVYIAQVERGSKAWRYGLREGDVVLSVNQKPVETVEQLSQYAVEKDTLLMNLQRGNASVFIVVR